MNHMVALPKDDPLFVNLNTYYLDVNKLIEHLQGEVGSGGVLFRSYRAEGALFFDQDEVITGIFESSEESLSGQAALHLLTDPQQPYNFNVCVYRIGPEDVYFWASLPNAEKIYKDLSNEFTDLDGLINKMGSERLTGFIEVQFVEDNSRGMIFLINGRTVGADTSWSDDTVGGQKALRDDIVQKTKTQDAVFNVCQIPITRPETAEEEPSEPMKASEDVIFALEEFLSIFEETVRGMRRSHIDFKRLLKHKFVENAEKYAFLDPFAAEFEYENHHIRFNGNATGKELSRGVIFSVLELAEELQLLQQFSSRLQEWSERHAGKLIELDIMV
jgi:hypothetical protein